ncbi:hypothetical protein PAAG_05398 [Paracoccidioides lutzii Pb01]|uniref:G-patch domain-containing protein n=1 Tax=Paracoccidioides lutzii (strain ATCC MYA-826 / Pb01) TaxID=502779 RepID=C1H3Q5_PARBA|nr:hypothetical protein PAAG_05398 [Paracoccidioides lutzii Pb01]EEH34349.1 hypothetical protein PAAG_05398 [Paracoccidioides lutzii Pb01]
MDARAYLFSQGWPGPGNPLNPTRRPGPHGGLGLTKPILISRKKNTHGLGKKTTHDYTNQWWLRGFEAALKGVGDDGSATPSSDGSGFGASGTSELYRFFVKGEGLEGTINRIVGKDVKGKEEMRRVGGDSVGSGEGGKKRKRKQRNETEDAEERGEERALMKETSRKKRKRDGERPFEGGNAGDGVVAVESIEKRRRSKKEKKENEKEKDPTKLEGITVDKPADKRKRKKWEKLGPSESGSPAVGEEGIIEEADEDAVYDKNARKKQKEQKEEAQRGSQRMEKESRKNGRKCGKKFRDTK